MRGKRGKTLVRVPHDQILLRSHSISFKSRDASHWFRYAINKGPPDHYIAQPAESNILPAKVEVATRLEKLRNVL